MTGLDYLAERKITMQRFAEEVSDLEPVSRQTIYNIFVKGRRPNATLANAIIRISGHAITIDDLGPIDGE